MLVLTVRAHKIKQHLNITETASIMLMHQQQHQGYDNITQQHTQQQQQQHQQLTAAKALKATLHSEQHQSQQQQKQQHFHFSRSSVQYRDSSNIRKTFFSYFKFTND